jgi:hypothetical protein
LGTVFDVYKTETIMGRKKINKAQEEFLEAHPEMIKDADEKSKDKDHCQCKKPTWAFEKPSLRTDGTYFNFCNQCKKFRTVTKFNTIG